MCVFCIHHCMSFSNAAVIKVLFATAIETSRDRKQVSLKQTLAVRTARSPGDETMAGQTNLLDTVTDHTTDSNECVVSGRA
jgi:hypothetical protein